MAIKIDLLPGYVKLKRDLHRSIAACVVAMGVIAGVLLTVLHQRKLDLQTAETNRVAAAEVVAQVEAATTEKTTALTAAAPLLNAVSFMSAASKTGPQRAALLDLVRQYIYPNAIVSSIDISDGQNVFIKATVRDPREYQAFVINLRRGSDAQGGTLFKGLPVASGPGGFANGAVNFVKPKGDGTSQAVVINYPVNITAQGVLLNPISVPAASGAAAAPTASGAAGSSPAASSPSGSGPAGSPK